MSLYQCENCGCCENTALAMQPCTPVEWFDWSGKAGLRGMHLCSACRPTRYADGKPVEDAGKWHGQFERVFLPKGEFRTNRQGNLEHKQTGRTDFRAFAITPPPIQE